MSVNLITANEAKLRVLMNDEYISNTINSINYMIEDACFTGKTSIYVCSESLYNNNDVNSLVIRKTLKSYGYHVLSKHKTRKSSNDKTFNSFGVEISW